MIELIIHLKCVESEFGSDDDWKWSEKTDFEVCRDLVNDCDIISYLNIDNDPKDKICSIKVIRTGKAERQ